MKKIGILSAIVVLLAALPADSLAATKPKNDGLALRKKYKSCDAVNRNPLWVHGVGVPGAVDKVVGNTEPVVEFTVDESTYLLLWAGSESRTPKNPYGGKYDRDKDGIACEQP